RKASCRKEPQTPWLPLFGDPASNRWIARIRSKPPIRWTRQAVIVEAKTFSAGEYFPALIYPNPLNSHRYLVLNSGLTIDEQKYRADYSLPRRGDFAVFQFQPQRIGALAGLFDQSWRLPVQLEP